MNVENRLKFDEVTTTNF